MPSVMDLGHGQICDLDEAAVWTVVKELLAIPEAELKHRYAKAEARLEKRLNGQPPSVPEVLHEVYFRYIRYVLGPRTGMEEEFDEDNPANAELAA